MRQRPWKTKAEGVIDVLNDWFGSVLGIVQQAIFVIVWVVWQFTPWRFDRWPFIGLMIVLTVASYITNAMLMNRATRQAALMDAILHRIEMVLAHVDARIQRVDERSEEMDGHIDDLMEEHGMIEEEGPDEEKLSRDDHASPLPPHHRGH